jgi:hypothetical protein
MTGPIEVPCAAGTGPSPFADGCECGTAGCHCLCFDPCDEECGHEICAQWHAWFDTLPADLAREIIRVYWVEPMRVTLAEALIEVIGPSRAGKAGSATGGPPAAPAEGRVR